MRPERYNGRFALALMMTLILTACASVERYNWIELKPEGIMADTEQQITGTIHYLDLEGGLYVIRDATGINYNPVNLPKDFRVDGLAIEAIIQRQDEQMSIGMVGPVVEVQRIKRRLPNHPSESSDNAELLATMWRLEDLAGTGVMDYVQATLTIAEDGRVNGSASCNSLRGSATVTGQAITVSLLATTRMMCPEAVMNQEKRYLAALQKAERYEIAGPFLYIYVVGESQPLRFIKADQEGM